jgi:hypothetical protein
MPSKATFGIEPNTTSIRNFAPWGHCGPVPAEGRLLFRTLRAGCAGTSRPLARIFTDNLVLVLSYEKTQTASNPGMRRFDPPALFEHKLIWRSDA